MTVLMLIHKEINNIKGSIFLKNRHCFIQESFFHKFIYYHKMWHVTAYNISASHSFLNLTKNEMICFYRVSELKLPTLIQRCDKKSFNFYPVQKRETN